MITDIEVDSFLEHHGVKGMKWGVRRQRRNQARFRGGVKGGPKISKVRAAATLGPIDLIRGRGITGGEHRKAVRVQGQLNRFNKGEATPMDLIKRYGSTRVSDLVPVRAKNAKRLGSTKTDAAAVGALIGLYALNIAAAQAVKRRA